MKTTRLPGDRTDFQAKVLGKAKNPTEPGKYLPYQKTGLIMGPVVFLLLMFLPVTAEFTYSMKAAAASTSWVAIWWVSEALPIPVTSLLPLVLFPFSGALSLNETASGYSHPIVFLMMGGFMLAVSMERWNFHRRLALSIISVVGTNPSRLILGCMLSTGFLSMWISNTATAMMMTPIGLAVTVQLAALAAEQGLDVDVRAGKFGFGMALMLGIAYSASIGGMGTLIGSPPNAIFASVADVMFGLEISFAKWILYGLPIAVIMTFLAWFYLIRLFPMGDLHKLQGGRQFIRAELDSLGKISREEKMVFIVFCFTALAWILRSLVLNDLFPALNDAMISVMAIIILFVLPVNLKKGDFLLNWDTAVKIPWGVLLLIGGGISIAACITETGLGSWIGGFLAGMEGVSMFLSMFIIVTLVILLSNVTSNTGTASMMMPVTVAMAMAMGIHPFGLMITAATAASFVFMLPVGTPPNAIVFGTGYVTMVQMAKAGLILTVLSIILIPLITYFWLPAAWGINLNIFPAGW